MFCYLNYSEVDITYWLPFPSSWRKQLNDSGSLSIIPSDLLRLNWVLSIASNEIKYLKASDLFLYASSDFSCQNLMVMRSRANPKKINHSPFSLFWCYPLLCVSILLGNHKSNRQFHDLPLKWIVIQGFKNWESVYMVVCLLAHYHTIAHPQAWGFELWESIHSTFRIQFDVF